MLYILGITHFWGDFDHFLKFVPVDAIKTCRGRRDIAPHILNLGTRWRRQHAVTPRPLYLQGQKPQYSSNRRTVGPQNRSGDFVDRKTKRVSETRSSSFFKVKGWTDSYSRK